MEFDPNKAKQLQCFHAKITILKIDIAQSLGYNTNIIENISIKKYL